MNNQHVVRGGKAYDLLLFFRRRSALSLATLVANPEEYYRIDPDLLKSERENILLCFNMNINKCD
ncbi:MAG: hypothetical protein ACI89D_001686 [Bermanella sp.]|jgi:hypothetical protein